MIFNDKFILFQNVKIKADNKLAKLFYDNSILYYENESFEDYDVSQLVYDTYVEILRDPHLKYFMYYHALEDLRDKNNKNYVFCDAYSPCYETVYGIKYSSTGTTNAARFITSSDLIFVSVDVKNVWYPIIFAHEQIHRTYHKLYNKKGCSPYNFSDFSKLQEYMMAFLNDYLNLEKNHNSTKNLDESELTQFQKVQNIIFDSVNTYPDHKKAEEIIAHCQQFKFWLKELNHPCPEINKYVEKNVIPDLISFVEHHALCKEIAEYDSTIKCAGTNIIDEAL